MTEKEGKVIKSFKRYINFQESTIDDYYKMDEEYYKDQIEQLELSTQLLKTILNLIENQQIALEQKDKEIQELKADRVEKDKIIDLMARYINSTDKDEDVCRETGATYNCTEYHDCEECIIEFFKKKARGENEKDNSIRL